MAGSFDELDLAIGFPLRDTRSGEGSSQPALLR